MVVDPLMRVTGDEEVVGTGPHRSAQQTPLRGVEVLRLVDHRVGVEPGVG